MRKQPFSVSILSPQTNFSNHQDNVEVDQPKPNSEKTEVDADEKKTEEVLPGTEKPETDTEAPKAEPEVKDETEAKVAADEAEKEKKAKKSSTTRDRILSSFR